MAGEIDVAGCIGREVVLALTQSYGHHMSEAVKDDAPMSPTWKVRVLGHDTFGLWVEPAQYVAKRDAGLASAAWHMMVPWGAILGIFVDPTRGTQGGSSWRGLLDPGKAMGS